ncbi:hypothetical protein Zmor_018626 [Zophobas morio]|uniref:Endonuclease/exonuclease/phosphatase domain-containing protein n=1 Tax=Zophobas morio TaxID=2755281 RepID=A0AA38IAU9_9CUCU|nr:hypothetical protein Zmor_018626 [Zophobas morio]
MRAKLTELEVLLYNDNYSVAGISEFWMTASEVEGVRINKFSPKSHFSRNSAYGGSMVLVREYVSCNSVSHMTEESVENHCEISAVYLDKAGIFFINIYRPPTGDFNILLDALNNILEPLHTLSKDIIIARDLNIKFNCKDPLKDQLCDFMLSYELVPIVYFPRRYDNCLDNVFTNLHPSPYKVEPVNTGMSDHLGVRLELQLTLDDRRNNKPIKFRPITEYGKFSFYNSLSTVDWSFIQQDNLEIDKKFNEFIRIVQLHASLAFPERIIVSNRTDGNYKIKWFDKELQEMRSKLQLLSEFHNTQKTDESRKARNHLRTAYRNKLIEKKNKSTMINL